MNLNENSREAELIEIVLEADKAALDSVIAHVRLADHPDSRRKIRTAYQAHKTLRELRGARS